MSNIRQITVSHGEIIEDITIPKEDFCYEMTMRIWVTSNNTFIREWTANEYANLNPNGLYIIGMELDNKNMIEVVAHCKEYGTMSAYKDGHKVISYYEWTDYLENKGGMS